MASVRLMLYTSKKLKDDTHPVMLVVTKDRVRKYYSMGYSCQSNEWIKDGDRGGRFSKNVAHASKKNKALTKKLWQAEEIITNFEADDFDWTHSDFKDKFIGVKSRDVFEYFGERITMLQTEGKIGNASAYRDARNALCKFVAKKNLRFNEISFAFLKKYEHHLRSRGVKDTTISAYMRTLRALINRAVKEKICKSDYYPFKEYQISELNHSTRKRAISMEEIEKILQSEPEENTTQLHSKHLFTFSFYCRGMNFKDMALLKWSDIHGNRIHYRRSKTGKEFSIKISPPIQVVLDYQKSHNPDSPYVFSILDESYQMPQAISTRIKSGLRTYNKHLKIFAKTAGLDAELTSYVTRHSWATILKRKGVDYESISRGLGHSDVSTTKIYIDEIEDGGLDEIDGMLL